MAGRSDWPRSTLAVVVCPDGGPRAWRRAGIGYVEVVAGDTPAELRRLVERLVLSP